MTIFELIKKIIQVNKGQIYTIVSTEALLRAVAWYVTPIFYYLRTTPNVISVIALITGISASFIIVIGGKDAYLYGIMVYILSIVFDHCDGNIARLRNMPTFFGRFMDGLFDIIVQGFIQLSLLSLILIVILPHIQTATSMTYLMDFEINIIAILGITLLSLFSTPMRHMIADRYGGYCRWINEEHKLSLSPTLRTDVSFRFVDFLNDMQLILIILGVFSNQFIFIYFIINLITSVIMVSFYFFFAKKRMSIHANDHRTYLNQKDKS